MGTADIVPGFSGGTVALVLGIYDRLIRNIRTGAHALKQLLTGDIDGFKRTLGHIEWVWLITLLGGILLAVATLSSVLGRLLQDEPVAMAGLFFGLVVGAIVIAYKLIDRVDAIGSAIMAAAAIALFLILGLRADTEVAEGTAEVVTQPFWVFFLAGSVAICAMILPGISGSLLLVMLGMYTEVLGAVHDRALLPMLAFAVGCVTGLALFSTLLNWLLDNYRDWVIGAMVGLMLGSLRVLWPWPLGVESTRLEAPEDPVVLPVVLAVVGVVAVLVIERISVRAGHHTVSSPT